jgi:16S rRNA (guanine527-N7)-methyltransferase
MTAATDFPSLQETAQTRLGVSLTRRQLDAFAWYAAELVSWNERFNLTAITDPSAIEVKHFLDSLSCLLALKPRSGDRMVDIGSGAGFPGLPLKIVMPWLQVTLVEATGKKAEFCRHVVEGLALESVTVVHARAEDVGQMAEHRQAYHWAVARAVAHLQVLAEYLMPLVRLGGRAIAQKGETGPAEAHAAEGALRLLGGRVQQLITVELPRVPETRYLVVMEKTAATPSEYPRRAGMPTRKPLG